VSDSENACRRSVRPIAIVKRAPDDPGATASAATELRPWLLDTSAPEFDALAGLLPMEALPYKASTDSS